MYERCDTQRFTSEGVLVKKHADKEEEVEIKADVVVLATGFERPGIDFLPEDLFPERYEVSLVFDLASLRKTQRVLKRPNLYLQNFSTEDWSVLLTNAAYQNAIGTV